MTHTLISFLTSWSYLAVFGLAFISAMGIPIGAELAIMFTGAVASGHVITEGHTHVHVHFVLWLIIVVATIGEVLGSTVGYAIGRFGGRPLADRLGKYVLLTHKDLDRAEAWFQRRGDPMVFFGRFIPLLRSFVSLAAGIGEMSLALFVIFTTLGCGIWCAALALVGNGVGQNWTTVEKDFSDAGYVLGAVVVLIIVAGLLHRFLALRKEDRERREGRGQQSERASEREGERASSAELENAD